ncbi:hypothetical protein niasHT_004276 [Heterodera trifolii]|uniref:Uncharacterized protein n=1 Tax=Heterodera trifolii TaxID=157864 RepID=A0ABD2LNE8_9BILA
MSSHLLFSFLAFCSLLISIIFACGGGPALPADPFDPLGPWHQRHLDCGIPPFAYRLPSDAQAKIHAIWVKYQPGDECDDEQEATRAVISAIPEEVRMQTFKGVCGPGFLKNESGEVVDKIRHVWFNDELNVEQKQAEFRKIAKEMLKGESAKRFDQFDQKLSKNIAERQQTIQAMSQAGRDAYNKWTNMRKEERTFLAALPAEVRVELGLICPCCKTDKTGGQPSAAPKTRAARAAVAEEEADKLALGLAQADAQALTNAAMSECF